MSSSKKSTSSLNKESTPTSNLGSQSIKKSASSLGSQKIQETRISQTLSKSNTKLTEQPTETIEKKEENAENSDNAEITVTDSNEPSVDEKDKEIEEKLGNSIENTLKEIDNSIKKIEKKKKKRNSKKKGKKSKKKVKKEGNEGEEDGKEGEEETENNKDEEEKNIQEDEELDSSDDDVFETIITSDSKDSFNDYGFSDSDIDYYDEPLIKDIMTPPIIDENSTFTWIPQLSDYIEDVIQNLLLEAKREQDELIREMEEKQEEEEDMEDKEENKEENNEQSNNENNEEKKEDNGDKKSDEITIDEQKKEENKTEEESKKEDEEKKEDENMKILTDEELLEQIEKDIDISNIIDEPVLSFGVNLSKSSELEDITSEDEEEQELKEEEDEKKHEEFMNETFEILRSETPINPENINEFADYFAKGNEDSQFDLGGSKNSVHSSKDIFDEDGDEESKTKDENENEDNEKRNDENVEEEEEEEEEKASNAIDREQFIENLKLEIEKYERNNTKNLFLQNKLYELFRKKRPDEHRDGDKSMNDQEQRYLSSMYEYKELKNEYDDINNKKQEIANSHKEKLQEKKKESDKLYHEFYKLKQHIAQNAKSTRTGNEFSLKVFEQLEGLEKKKDEMVTAARLENIRLQNKLRRQESVLRQKEELADGLHLIDFEQLKIENQTYNEKIEERNEELLKLRKKINNIVQVLTHVKEKLQFVQAENVHLKEELKELDEKVTRQRDTLPAIKQSRDKLKHNTQILRQKHGLLGNRILLMDFESKIDETENLKRQVEELQVYHTELMLKRLSYKRKIKKSHIILAGC